MTPLGRESGGGPSSFNERIEMGLIASLEDARRIQKDNTGIIVDRPGAEGMTIEGPFGTETFENTAQALEWLKTTGGLIYEDGEVVLGEPIEDKWARLGKE